MGDQEYKKFDSADKYRCSGVRLAKDAESRDGEHGKMVRLTFASESRKEQHSPLWVEANIADFHSEAASFLLKGDVLHEVEGKPCLRRYGDDNEKFSFVIDRCSIVIPIPLFSVLKDRGFAPGKSSKKPAPTGKRPAPAIKPKQPASKKQVQIPDDPDDDMEIEDDEE